MDKRLITRKLLLIAFCLLVAAAFIPNMTVTAENTKVLKENNDFTVSAKYGLDGMVFYDYPMQAIVTVESRENFSGVIRLLPEAETWQNISGYGKRITLAAGESKTFKMTVNTPSNNGEVYLSILNDKDKVIYEEKTTLTPTSVGSFVEVGVLSDDYSGVGYFNGVTIDDGTYTGAVTTNSFTGETFPEDSQVLKVLDYIVIDNFDTSSLSEKQYNALKKWVSDGGVLVLSLGSHYQSVLSGFKDDFLTGTFGNMAKKNLSWNTGGEVLELNDVDCIAFVLDGGRPVDPIYMDDWSYIKPVGLGNVIVLPYSLSMEPLASYTGRSRVASAILYASASARVLNGIQGSGGYDSIYNMGTNLTSVSENVKGPSALLYGLLLTLYIVLVGPVLYIILSKVGKREKLWIAIPIVSLAFTGIIYCTSFIYRVNKPILNTFSLIQVGDVGASETVYSKVVCPSAKQYSLELSDEYDEFRSSAYHYDYGFFADRKSADGKFDSMFMDNGTNKELILNSDSNFDSFEFSAAKVIDKSIGNYTLNLKCSSTGFSGTVTNDTAYDLKGVVVAYESYLYIVGDLKKGETFVLDGKDMIQSYGYGTFDQIYFDTPDRLSYQEYQVDSSIESYLFNDSEFGVGHVWGIIESYKPGLMDDNKVKQDGMAVIMNDFFRGYGEAQ